MAPFKACVSSCAPAKLRSLAGGPGSWGGACSGRGARSPGPAPPCQFPEATEEKRSRAQAGVVCLAEAAAPPAPARAAGAAMAGSLGSWLGGCLLVSALGMVPPPENVRMNSVNFKNILQWESPAFTKGNLTFTAQFQSYRTFQDICVSTTSMECDFSSISKYGDHTLRVRAEFADEHSDWVNITFCPVDDTIIGPPGVQVEVLADSLHMRFLAPKIENEYETWTMKNVYNSWAYNVQYWKNGSDEKFQITPQYDFEVLRNLEPWTTYCIQVQGFLPDRNKTGEWSEPVCEETNNDETVPSWMVAIILMASVFVVCLALLGCFTLLWYIYKKTKYAFCPGNSLPQHLKEFLGHPHHNTLLFLSFPFSDENDVFDKLSVITEDSESGSPLATLSLWKEALTEAPDKELE
uniref:interleukin-10 receptor subunit beta n=1 Tax=Callithrix jacchus TaxID=9483 RepID=UPI0023DCF368|nr:interleukin-10 receptor subunit beta [Callithrix jacchus]XP_054105008.1 interleukin-10 receptor subunit beta [Callithrix jacchus]XP_054105009.1 interleukin-10 receptor subunit beta [Callithrix jacchus]